MLPFRGGGGVSEDRTENCPAVQQSFTHSSEYKISILHTNTFFERPAAPLNKEISNIIEPEGSSHLHQKPTTETYPDSDQSHSHTVSRMRGYIPSLPQYAFTTWCSVKTQGHLTFTVNKNLFPVW
jgi:hypothetical protein